MALYSLKRYQQTCGIFGLPRPKSDPMPPACIIDDPAYRSLGLMGDFGEFSR